MSFETVFGNIISILSLIVTVSIIILSVRKLTEKKNKVLSVFFTFAMVSYFMSEVYYFAYNFLIPDTRMPFAANEIAEASMILLLCAVLETVLGKERKINIPALIFSTVFIGVNIALWVMWADEWIKNILFGLPYIYYLYLLLKGVIKTKAASSKEIIFAAACSSLVFVLEAIAYATYDTVGPIVEISCYPFMYILWILIVIKTIYTLRKEDKNNGEAMYLSFTLHIWTMLLMFMSADIFYNVANIMYILVMPLMYLAFKKELSKDDIR
ncbi:MAG: hypothetical protein II399_10390 [Lachnospiraceae bacterium]|nr:hypothetical protein [Lachnospiraceae bacterium]